MIRNSRVLGAVAVLGMNLIGCGTDGSTAGSLQGAAGAAGSGSTSTPAAGMSASVKASAGSVALSVAGSESKGETAAGAQSAAGAKPGGAGGVSGAAAGSGAAAASGAGGVSGAAAGSGAGGASGAAGSDAPTTQGMPKYEPSPNNPMECPAIAPENPVGDCLGLPIYLNCEYGDDTYWYVCVCDWYHWLCAGT
jgi:hypothetical protein